MVIAMSHEHVVFILFSSVVVVGLTWVNASVCALLLVFFSELAALVIYLAFVTWHGTKSPKQDGK